jgi:ATP-binding cassette subfamily C protein
LVLLDEATSSLDAATEFEISQAIAAIKNQATIILIAHRLSTVKNADLVIYLEEGRIRASGTFDQVRTLIPKFNEQARLMGL